MVYLSGQLTNLNLSVVLEFAEELLDIENFQSTDGYNF
jgi:hypothetical protein